MGTEADQSVISPDFFIVAAEPSADLHGAALLKALLAISPSLKIEAIAGEKMGKLPITTLYSAESLGQIGLRGIFKKGVQTLRLFYKLLRHVENTNPAIILLIDFPFFNIKFAKALRRRGYQGKIFQFICPKVWVWGKERIGHIAENYDELFTIFPFEKTLFEKTSLQVTYVGNPLIEKYPEAIALKSTVETVGIFPGSRLSELKKHIPILQKVLKIIMDTHPELKFTLFAATSTHVNLLKECFPNCRIALPEDQKEELLKIDCALAKSGTITLELALLGIPSVVFYAASRLEEFWARKVLNVKIPHISLPNILLDGEVYKEILGKEITIEGLIKEFFVLLETKKRAEQREKLAQLRSIFGNINTPSHLADLLFRRLSGS